MNAKKTLIALTVTGLLMSGSAGATNWTDSGISNAANSIVAYNANINQMKASLSNDGVSDSFITKIENAFNAGNLATVDTPDKAKAFIESLGAKAGVEMGKEVPPPVVTAAPPKRPAKVAQQAANSAKQQATDANKLQHLNQQQAAAQHKQVAQLAANYAAQQAALAAQGNQGTGNFLGRLTIPPVGASVTQADVDNMQNQSLQESVTAINHNTAEIDNLYVGVTNNQNNIQANADNIKTAMDSAADALSNTATNLKMISDNTANINQNASDIGQNKADIADNKTGLQAQTSINVKQGKDIAAVDAARESQMILTTHILEALSDKVAEQDDQAQIAKGRSIGDALERHHLQDQIDALQSKSTNPSATQATVAGASVTISNQTTHPTFTANGGSATKNPATTWIKSAAGQQVKLSAPTTTTVSQAQVDAGQDKAINDVTTVATTAQKTADQNKKDLSSTKADVAKNTGNIATNKTDIATLKTTVATEKTDIATLKTNVADEQKELTAHDKRLVKVEGNQSADHAQIATNQSLISKNGHDIGQNKTDIASTKQSADIAEKHANSAQLKADDAYSIATANTADITRNTSDIANLQQYAGNAQQAIDAGDAATLKQSKDYTDSKFKQLKNQVKEAEKRADAGSASALAAVGLPGLNNGQTWNIGAGVGQFGDASAVAVGGNYRVSENVSFKLGVTATPTTQNYGAFAGVSIGN